MIKIPVLLSTDDNYIPLVDVCLISLFENKKDETYYDVYIFVPSTASFELQSRILELKDKYSNIDITFVDMKNEFAFLQKINHAYISLPTYYRLTASEYLSNYDKCIYIDCDTVVCTDLAELYNTDLNNSIICASLGTGAIYLSQEEKDNAAKWYGIPDFDHYINAGVLVMNLKKIREDNMVQIWRESSKKLHQDVDQGVLNETCYGKIAHLPFRYNARLMDLDRNSKILIDAFGENEINEAFNNPAILHFSSAKKPWLGEYNGGGADIFWKYARKSSFYEQIVCWKNTKLIADLRMEIEANNLNLYHLINFRQLKYKYYFYRFIKKALLFIKFSKLNKKVEKLHSEYEKVKAIKKNLYR